MIRAQAVPASRTSRRGSAYVGLGSNLGAALSSPKHQVEAALDALARLPDTVLSRRSRLYRTAPQGSTVTQPEFVNAAALLDTALEPEELLDHLLRIELQHGRERPFPNAPRTLDLDLLLFDDRVIDGAALHVPHPRMHERAFVLIPLLEIEPDIEIPGLGSARDCLARSTGQPVAGMD